MIIETDKELKVGDRVLVKTVSCYNNPILLNKIGIIEIIYTSKEIGKDDYNNGYVYGVKGEHFAAYMYRAEDLELL